MISYLKGILSEIQKLGNQRVIITIEVNQIGYDVQVTPRLLTLLPPFGEPVHIHTHLQVREDQMVLFGFNSRPERDLFRQLVSVSGIGPQMAMAMLDTLGLQELVQSVVAGNIRVLSRTPGVGAKTAERIVLELKTKLSEWRQQTGLAQAPLAGPAPSIQEEVEMTLLALGYTTGEIVQALQAVGQNTALPKSADTEDWIREAIAWLSR
ncbi:Holliday junction branch migration protein RuvA [Almyronema epifaneia]|uniref:Holliday junction branch migration complex subunit RuvA n=1 Tax=Almyronema epifaneia S1 TaxID=2991925 RepID=A0ABW6IHD4_9CYAN